MTSRVLVIGGYGNFGRFISQSLADESDIIIIIAGRSVEKAKSFAKDLDARNTAEATYLDIHKNLDATLSQVNPDIVIHTSGPFQDQSYAVAEACIKQGCHYIDLADGSAFVAGISRLDKAAKEKDVLVVSGASSVPGLTSAIVDNYLSDFTTLHTLDYGITTAQKTTRGLATTAAILGYTGKPFTTLQDGVKTTIYGWQDLHARNYSSLGKRWLCACDVPDLEIFPDRYPSLKNIRFSAGLEIPLIHFTLWGLSWLVRLGIIRKLSSYAPTLLKLSFLFDRFGSDASGFHMNMTGEDNHGDSKSITFELIARKGDGPYIPCMPSIILAKRLASGSLKDRGAVPCIGLITLDEYINALQSMSITWDVSKD